MMQHPQGNEAPYSYWALLRIVQESYSSQVHSGSPPLLSLVISLHVILAIEWQSIKLTFLFVCVARKK